ncbi:hypothetical protein PFISCL1PPCAC_24692, partial [Pristionchus fissidentatus]
LISRLRYRLNPSISMFSRLFLLLALTFVTVQSQHKGCTWHGEAPKCGYTTCPKGTRKVAVMQGGWNNEFGLSVLLGCLEGEKSYCCGEDVIRADFEEHCSWYGSAPICAGECPEGTVEIARGRNWRQDDNRPCYMWGSKAFCLDKEVLLKN